MTLTDHIRDAALKAGCTPEIILGQRRDRRTAHARQDAMADAYATGRYSLPQIGRAFNRDHTTVLYAVRIVEQRRLAQDIADVLMEVPA